MGTRIVAIDDDIYRAAEDAADAAGVPVSAWLARTVQRAARIEDGLRAVAESEAGSPAPDSS